MQHFFEIIPSRKRRLMKVIAQLHRGRPTRSLPCLRPLVFVAFAALAMAHGAYAAKPAEAAPDLTVVGLFVIQSGGGNSVTATETTSNTGDLAAPATTTRFYLSSDPVLDAADLALGSRNVPELSPGASNSAATSLPIPATVPAGLYFIIAKVDPDGAVDEANEDNNTAVAGPIRLNGDLVAWLDVPAAWSTPAAGATILVDVYTRNEATRPVPASRTDVYLSRTATLDAGAVLVGSRMAPALGPGEIHPGLATSLTLPAGETGTRYLLAKANGDSAVVENNVANNVSVPKPITIGADLIVTIDEPGSVTSVPAGATVTVTDFTRNNNSAPAGASTTKFYLVRGLVLDASAVLLGSRPVPALPPST